MCCVRRLGEMSKVKCKVGELKVVLAIGRGTE
jgi:hypothetical protein